MANRVPFYFYAPTWEFPPNGPIKLGNVITSIKKPEWPLYTAPLPTDDEVFSTEKRQVKISTEKLREGRFSILTRFLSALGVGVDVGVDRSKSTAETFAFDLIETTQYFPRDEYLRACIEAEPVRKYLGGLWTPKVVYIITGIQIVRGAAANSATSSSLGGNLEVEVDGTVWSGGTAPVSGGPGIQASVSQKKGTSWEGSSDFVLAYRVRKVTVSKKSMVSAQDVTKGAMAGGNRMISGWAAMMREREHGPELVISVDEMDVAEGGDGFVAEEVTNGDDTVICCRAE